MEEFDHRALEPGPNGWMTGVERSEEGIYHITDGQGHTLPFSKGDLTLLQQAYLNDAVARGEEQKRARQEEEAKAAAAIVDRLQ